MQVGFVPTTTHVLTAYTHPKTPVGSPLPPHTLLMINKNKTKPSKLSQKTVLKQILKRCSSLTKKNGNDQDDDDVQDLPLDVPKGSREPVTDPDFSLPTNVERDTKKTVKKKKQAKEKNQKAEKESPTHVFFVVDLIGTSDGVTTQSRSKAIEVIQKNTREYFPSYKYEGDQDYLDYLDEMMNQPESSIDSY
ncbi:unnamed protein product [Vicia faba]|uniref:Uncharacterized protein n=1 Tax=Vicia faba TaxID=3906 RepID=A0AAV1AN62_VICFA|nr:unnamed protein product [Vicia faba]